MLPCRIFARIHGEESGWCATGDLDPAFVGQHKFSGDNFLLHGLGGGKSIFWKKTNHPYFGEMIQFDEHIFEMGWNHQPEYFMYTPEV